MPNTGRDSDERHNLSSVQAARPAGHCSVNRPSRCTQRVVAEGTPCDQFKFGDIGG
jgi:hypothetical protein